MHTYLLTIMPQTTHTHTHTHRHHYHHLQNETLLQLIEVVKSVGSLSVAAPHLIRPYLKCMRFLMVDREQAIRAQALRTLRYLATDETVVAEMSALNLDIFIARSLEVESKFVWERMQALKLVRHIIALDPQCCPRALIQSLVAIADHPRDDFRRVCLDAIKELALTNPERVAACNGIRTMVEAILDPTCQDISCSLTLTLLFLLDQVGFCVFDVLAEHNCIM